MKKRKTEKEFDEAQAKIKEVNDPINEGIRDARGLVSQVETEVSKPAAFMNRMLRGSLSPEDCGVEADNDGMPVRNEDGTYKKAVPPGDAGAGTGVQPGKRELSEDDKIRKVAGQSKINLGDV